MDQAKAMFKEIDPSNGNFYDMFWKLRGKGAFINDVTQGGFPLMWHFV